MEPQLSCDFKTSTLFERAMDLIDPPRWSTDTTNNDDCSSQYDDNVERDGETSELELHDNENVTEPVVKKVKFEDNTCFAPKTVTAADAIQAYDLLVQAASRSWSLSREALTQIAWNEIQIIADVYRALLVTSCLLLELLSKETTASASRIDDSIEQEQPCRQAKNENDTQTSVDHVPVLLPTIERGLLSSARRAILLLQALERICTAKSVAENTVRGASTNLFSSGGDDIHDYERSETDLVSNYDWHDDGNLPPAFQRSSVLHECCHLSIQQDPPCSRFERNAWTRHWYRGERVVSMNIEDYIDNVQYDDIEDPPPSKDSEMHSRGEEGKPLTEMPCSNHDYDGVEPTDNITFSEGNRKKRRRTTKSYAVKQTALVEDRNDVVKEGFLILSRDSCGALLDNDERTSSNKGFLRVYVKLHISGWLSIEDRSIRLKTNGDSPMTHTRKCLKSFIYSGTTCQPCLPDGTMSFHFQLDGVRHLRSSMLFNHDYETKDSPAKSGDVESKLLFAVDEDAGSTFADGCGWVNALSGAAAKATYLRDQIRLEWNELGS